MWAGSVQASAAVGLSWIILRRLPSTCPQDGACQSTTAVTGPESPSGALTVLSLETLRPLCEEMPMLADLLRLAVLEGRDARSFRCMVH